MPRTAAVSAETIFEVLKDMPIFDANGELKKKKDPIWKEAIKYMPGINNHNLFIFVFQNRRDIKTNLMNYMNIAPTTIPVNLKKGKLMKAQVSNSDILEDCNYYETLNDDNEEDKICNDLSILTEMRNSEVYSNIIHKISVSPLSVYYWYPEQITLWMDLIYLESTVSFIVLDNIIADHIPSENLENSKVFLCALAVRLKKSVMLVGQMMSNSVASSEIKCFLNSWLQNKAPAPPNLVIDYSYNLLNGASLAFNSCTFDEYNIRCFKFLMSELESLPSTLIQIDIIGLINIVNKWTCFDSVLQSVKDLYLCGIMYISTIDNLDEFEETVISILTLCQSPYQNVELETRRLNLWEHLTTDTIQQMNQLFIDYETGKRGLRNFSSLTQTKAIDAIDFSNEIFTYIEQLKKRVIKICDFSDNAEKTPNEYYCPIILENLINLLTDFPSWTNIVNKNNFSSLVSICSTRLTYLFKHLKEPLSSSNFLIYHLEKIKVTTKEGLNYISNLKKRNEFPMKESLMQTTCNSENTSNSRLKLTAPSEEVEAVRNVEIDLNDIKNSVQSMFETLLNFDKSVENILNSNMQPSQETLICKLILDTCTESNTCEKFLGKLAQKFCSSSDRFAISFKRMFIDCYNTAELLDKSELKNASKLFAQLLISDSISWTILTILKISESTSSAKRNFMRILFRELSHQMGFKLREKFQNVALRTKLKGLFPTQNTKSINFACRFYRSIGLHFLANILKNKEEPINKRLTLKRSSSNSSISSTSSCEFAIEIKVKKKPDGDGLPADK